jgi:hypothetical protein
MMEREHSIAWPFQHEEVSPPFLGPPGSPSAGTLVLSATPITCNKLAHRTGIAGMALGEKPMFTDTFDQRASG